MNIIILFSMGRGSDAASCRLVVQKGQPLLIEVEARDRLGHASWRPAKLSEDVRMRVITDALIKSQMTPLQRIEQPRMLHPEGVVWNAGDVTIYLGSVA